MTRSRAAILAIAVLAAGLLAAGLLAWAGAVEAHVIERVSVRGDGAEAFADSSAPSISADGRYVAFASRAAEFVDADTNQTGDVFVRDRLIGITERVSVATGGAQGYDDSGDPSISADGRYVAFRSAAGGLVEGDTNNEWDVFVHERPTGTTERVSVATGGAQANGGDSGFPCISADGRYVAFMSKAVDLVDGDTNRAWDIFVHDRRTGATERVSVATDGAEGNGGSRDPSISADGRYVVFGSAATNLVEGDTNKRWDVFVHDRSTGSTERVSVTTGGAQATGGDSGCPSISADGHYVAFQSAAGNLVEADTNACWDVFVHDLLTGTTERVSVATAGTQGDRESYDASVSADGRYVAFQSAAGDLVYGDSNEVTDAFVRDLVDGTTSRVSVAIDGGPTISRVSSRCSITPSLGIVAPYVAFASEANDFVEGDTNGSVDVFVAALDPRATITGLDSTSGSTGGGIPVTITGTNFKDVRDVTFGGTPASTFTVNSTMQITATTPAHVAGAVQVRVVAGGGTTLDTAADDYTYVDAALLTTRYEQTDARLDYTGTWYSRADPRHSAGSQKYGWGRNASVTVAFEGTGLDWIGKTSPAMGKAQVTVDDGPPVLVDLYSGTTSFNQKVWSSGGLVDGLHMVTISYTGAKNALSAGTAINLDAVGVIGTLVDPATP